MAIDTPERRSSHETKSSRRKNLEIKAINSAHQCFPITGYCSLPTFPVLRALTKGQYKRKQRAQFSKRKKKSKIKPTRTKQIETLYNPNTEDKNPHPRGRHLGLLVCFIGGSFFGMHPSSAKRQALGKQRTRLRMSFARSLGEEAFFHDDLPRPFSFAAGEALFPSPLTPTPPTPLRLYMPRCLLPPIRPRAVACSKSPHDLTPKLPSEA